MSSGATDRAHRRAGCRARSTSAATTGWRPRTWCSTSARSTRPPTACCGCGCVLDGERIVTAEPIVGYMHRGAEKLFEVRDYRQIIVLANRHDWLSAFANELGVVLAAERMLGMEVPERAVWARTLLAELNRVLNHLMFLGSYPIELGAITPIFYAFRERETLQAVMEEVSGGRMHYMFNRVGGLKEELPAGWTGRARHAVDEVRRRLPDIENLVLGNEIFQRPHPRRRRPVAGAGARLRRQRPDRPRLRRRPRPAPGRALPGLRRAGRAGRDPDRRRLPGPVRVPARAGARLARPGRRLPGPAAGAAARAGQHAAAQGAQGARGVDVRLDREPARASTATTWSPAARRRPGGSSCGRPRSTTSRCSPSCCPAPWSPTWWRSSARCSSSSATSTSSPPATPTSRPRKARGGASPRRARGDVRPPACVVDSATGAAVRRESGGAAVRRAGTAVASVGAAVAAGSRGSESRSERGSSNGRSGRFASTVQASRSAGVASTAAAAGSSAGRRDAGQPGPARSRSRPCPRRGPGAPARPPPRDPGHVGRVAEGQLDQRHLQRDPADLGQLGPERAPPRRPRRPRAAASARTRPSSLAQLGDDRPQGHHLRLQGSGTGPVPAAHHRGEEPAPGRGSAVPSSHGPGRYALRGWRTVTPRGTTSHVTLVT